MHSGFFNIRSECSMNIKRKKMKSVSEEVSNDLKRIYKIFDYCKKHSNGKFLLGDFGAIDIFFTPVISRIVSYGLDRGEHDDYINSVLNHKFFKEWEIEAVKETLIIDHS
jgi:glutathione S-transferase